jgi:hypothetical protein
MDPITVSYSENVSGWTSFWSYIPEWMVCLNSNFYTFNKGNLYRHNDVSAPRTTYYNVAYGCSVQTIFNDDPSSVKLFKTIDLDSNNSWNVNLTTDLQDGSISRDWFDIKEGEWYSFIRYNPKILSTLTDISQIDASANYVRGIGTISSIGPAFPPNPAFIYTINLNAITPSITNSYEYGSSVYTLTGSTLVYLGQLDLITNQGMVQLIQGTILATPLVGQYLICISDPLAQSYGVRGYFLDITLSLPGSITTETELFAVGTSVFKSYM